jgi:histidyl-tRNA synthetase
VLELAKTEGLNNNDLKLDAYAVISDVSAMPLVLSTLQSLRAAGVSVQMHASATGNMGSMKSQFKRADSSGARYALIFGQDEIRGFQVTIKPLRDAGASQVTHSLSDLATWASTLQSVL